MNVTAATVRRSALDPGMEARAYNLEQERLYYDPSPERDSLVEVIDTGCLQVVNLVRRLVDSNLREGQAEREFLGWADRFATDLRDHEVKGNGLNAKAIARALRAPLRTLRSEADPAELAGAVRVIHRVLRSAPRSLVLAPAVEHNLGAASFALLREIVEGE